eukprot:TRINITY_DN8592_c0_g1_i11.p1 TRINITY_DN8592_c0_g1~~TRINITY_DN8592_c0_g1_i11.p1  ORF type:complete len:1055 (+),score=337.25 TRINITY_DN8592_c0_g1_i11:1267-4431(+)
MEKEQLQKQLDENKEEESKVRPVLESIKYLALTIWNLCISTPFGLAIILRIFILFWLLKYNSYLSIFFLLWAYISIGFTSTDFFCAVTPFLLIPGMVLQIIGTKFIEIKSIVPYLVPERYLNYFHFFGCFRYSEDSSVNSMWEFAWSLAGITLACAVMKMMQYIPEYNEWAKGHEEARKKDLRTPNNLEVTVLFFFEHTDKVYVILLYMVAFDKLDTMGTLVLIYLLFFMLFRNLARKCFILMIWLLGLMAMGRYVVLLLHILGLNYTPRLHQILNIVGIEINYEPTGILYRMGTDWELIIMYFCSYAQLKIIRYFAESPFAEIPINKESWFIKFASYLNDAIQAYLLWVIYFVFLTILALQEPSFFIQGYIIIVVLMMAVHIGADIRNSQLIGYKYSRPIWVILMIYNSLILFASYISNFVVYTGGRNLRYKESEVQLIKIVGLDFTQKEMPTLQLTFLPQFVILYLASFARQVLAIKKDEAEIREVPYKRKAWMWLIKFLDMMSGYSIHLVMFVIALLGTLWSLNFVMFLYFVGFAIHYGTLHLSYNRLRRHKGESQTSFKEKYSIIMEECVEQKEVTIQQRRYTLSFLLTIAVLSLFLTQLFAFVQAFKRYIDSYTTKNELQIHCAEVVEALGYYLGMVGLETPKTSLFRLIIGNVAILYLCAAEVRAVCWHENRMGYKYVQVIDKKFSLMDIFRSVLLKNALDSNQNIKYKITMMIIVKTILEHVILGSYLFAATGKNNLQAIAFIPVALFCVLKKLSLSVLFYISTYMWIFFIIQYFSFVCNITSSAVPQPLEDVIFIKAFNLSDWPIYKMLLSGWPLQRDWAYYLTLGAFPNTRYYFILDIGLLIVQAFYFQHFCHSFYTFSTHIESKRNDSVEEPNELPTEYELKPTRIVKLAYKFLKNVFFLYSHVFTLFFLIVMSSFTKGAINLVYLFVSVLLMQYNLFADIGSSRWKVPMYFRYLLKPYLFVDLTLQFTYQLPVLIQLTAKNKDVMDCIGIYDFKQTTYFIWIKAVIFTLVLYQDAISFSKEYAKDCRIERRKIRRLVTFLLNQ